jgi:transcriptional regulator of acetoin/glycerol metabolism
MPIEEYDEKTKAFIDRHERLHAMLAKKLGYIEVHTSGPAGKSVALFERALTPDYHPDYGVGHEMRSRAVAMVTLQGKRVAEVAELLHLHRSTIYKWIKDCRI